MNNPHVERLLQDEIRSGMRNRCRVNETTRSISEREITTERKESAGKSLRVQCSGGSRVQRHSREYNVGEESESVFMPGIHT